tara:strand:+ start:404 stop:724 length:321 start_codon:yes stop_codon:yes gene_type:complete
MIRKLHNPPDLEEFCADLPISTDQISSVSFQRYSGQWRFYVDNVTPEQAAELDRRFSVSAKFATGSASLWHYCSLPGAVIEWYTKIDKAALLAFAADVANAQQAKP